MRDSDYILTIASGLYVAGRLLYIACYAAYAFILFQLSSIEDRYRIASLCMLGCAAVNGLVILNAGSVLFYVLFVPVELVIAIVGIISEYNECMGHSSVLAEIDPVRSGKWRSLWDWYVRFMVAGILGIMFMWVNSNLGFIIVLCAGLGGFVLRILKLVYLYQTAQVFRRYQPDDFRTEP